MCFCVGGSAVECVLRGNGLPSPRGGPCGIFLCGDGGCWGWGNGGFCLYLRRNFLMCVGYENSCYWCGRFYRE